MKKISLILSLFLLCSCSTGIKREDYHVFSFDDYTIAVGYDDAEFLRLVFDFDIKEELEAKEKLQDIELYFWDHYFALADLENYKNKPISSDRATISRLVFYLDNLNERRYALDGIALAKSVRENCDTFHGEYVERNGYACIFGKNVHGKDSIVTLYGDIFGFDQDELSHLEIYVK